MKDSNQDKTGKPMADPSTPPAPQVPGRDVYFDRIIKFVPAPLLAGYAAATGMIAEDPVHIELLSWIIFGAIWAMCPLYVIYIPGEAQQNEDCSKRFHVLASIICFPVWAFALGGPFSHIEGYRPLYGALILVFASLLLPLIQKMVMKLGFFKYKAA